MAKSKVKVGKNKETKKTKVEKPEKKVKKEKVKQEGKVSQATKQYIYDNHGKLSVAEMAETTNLTKEEIEKILVSSELDERPLDIEGVTPIKLRRFGLYKGTTTMTPSQSMLDDRDYQNNLPSPEEGLKRYGKDVTKIEFKKKP